MKVNAGDAIEFFMSLPNDVLVEIADKDWEALERLCSALALDIQLLKENNESFSNRRNVC